MRVFWRKSETRDEGLGTRIIMEDYPFALMLLYDRAQLGAKKGEGGKGRSIQGNEWGWAMRKGEALMGLLVEIESR